MKIKKIAAIILSVCMVWGYAFTVSAEDDAAAEIEAAKTENTAGNPAVIDIRAKSVVLMEATTKKVLFEQSGNQKMPPASVTKIMTMLLVMESLESGLIKLDDKVGTSEHAASYGGSQIWLEKGETMTVDQLLKATAIASANDAAVALGEHIGGSETGFVAMMNARAKELGMNDTSFINACGLDADGHLTTAHDIAVMSAELLKYQRIKDYSTVWMDTLRDGKTELVNTNKLIKSYNGITGLKTGTTDGAGICISATAKREGMELIAVVMGSETSDDRFRTATNLLDYGFANYMLYIPDFETLNLKDIRVLHGTERQAGLEISGENHGIVIKKGKEKDVKIELELAENIEAPVEKNQTVGKILITLDGSSAGEFSVQTKQSVSRIKMGTAFLILLKELLKI